LGAILKQIIVIIVVKKRMCRAGPAVWYACPASGGYKTQFIGGGEWRRPAAERLQ